MIWEFASRGMAKITESAGLDFVIIDMEHSAFDTAEAADLIAWFKATDVAPFVRVPQGLYHFLARAMDAGALGVMVADVRSAEHAAEIVRAVKYAPAGNRGVGLACAHNDYVQPDPAEYFREANANTTVICQIESAVGLENVESIAATPGVDVLWVGQFDLSQSLGVPGQFHHPRFTDAIARVTATARLHGKAAGILPFNAQQAEDWVRAGFNVLSWSTDTSVYGNALRSEVAALRGKTAAAKA
jgi:2-dehydro-3-deoxyglucarate aldolase/4-hydroxy-2-oxoheptanedioate aldolase